MSASWTVVPKCMQATRNRRPLTSFIARRDKKGQTNCLLPDETMSGPLWTPEKTRAAQTTPRSFAAWMSSYAGKSFADFNDLHLPDTPVNLSGPSHKGGTDTALVSYDDVKVKRASSARATRGGCRAARGRRGRGRTGLDATCQHAGRYRQRAGDCLEAARSCPPARPVSARKNNTRPLARNGLKGVIASDPK